MWGFTMANWLSYMTGFVEQPAASWQSFSCYCQAYDSNSVLEFNE